MAEADKQSKGESVPQFLDRFSKDPERVVIELRNVGSHVLLNDAIIFQKLVDNPESDETYIPAAKVLRDFCIQLAVAKVAPPVQVMTSRSNYGD